MNLDEIKIMRLKDLAEDTLRLPEGDALHGAAFVERLAVRATEMANGVADLLEELERLKTVVKSDHQMIVVLQKERDGYKFAAEPPDPERAGYIRTAVEAIADLRADRFRLTQVLQQIAELTHFWAP